MALTQMLYKEQILISGLWLVHRRGKHNKSWYEHDNA